MSEKSKHDPDRKPDPDNCTKTNGVCPDLSDHISMDEIYSEVGEFGPWQMIGLALLWLPSAVSGLMVLTYSFVGLKPKSFFCSDAESGIDCGNGTPFPTADYPPDTVFQKIYPNKIDYCRALPLAPTSTSGDCQFLLYGNYTQCQPRDENTVVSYGEFDMHSTIVTDFNLICDQEYKIALVGSIYMVGLFVGAGLFGKLSDMIGRRLTVTMATFIGAVAQLLCGFANSFETYAMARFLTAIGAGVFLPAFTLSMELVGSKYRTSAGIAIDIPFAIGEALAGVLALFVRDWRMFQYLSSIPIFLSTLVYFVIPESPRWLIANGKSKELREVVNKIASVNKKSLSPASQKRFNAMIYKMETEEALNKSGGSSNDEIKELSDGEKVSISDVFKHPLMLKTLLIMFVNWMVVTLGYYGLSMAAVEIGDDVFTASILTALIEIPSYVFCLIFMDRLGRKPICFFTLFLTGVSCIPASFVSGPLQTALALAGKFGDSAAFALIFLYTAELYPTKIRSTVVGMCSMMARVGGILAPQVVLYLPTVTFKEAPMIVFGTTALVGAFLTLLLPESLGSLTLQTVQGVDDLGKVTKPFFAYWSDSKLRNHLHALTDERKKGAKVQENDLTYSNI